MINDNIIDFGMNMLLNRTSKKRHVMCLSVHFYVKLRDQGYFSVEKWYKNVNIFEKKIITFTVSQDTHYTLVGIVRPDLLAEGKCKIYFLDSLYLHDCEEIVKNTKRLLLIYYIHNFFFLNKI